MKFCAIALFYAVSLLDISIAVELEDFYLTECDSGEYIVVFEFCYRP